MIRTMLAVSSMMMLLCGCAHVMSEENLKIVDRSVTYGQLRERPEAFIGRTVLLGGVIAGVRSSGDMIMLEVARLELFKNEVPNEDMPSGGRFLAMSSDLIDPVIYRPGKLVTIIGEVKGKKVQKIDGVDYPYPLIAVKELRLFRASEPDPFSTANPYQNQVGDEKFLRRPPGLADGEPRRPY